MSEMIAWGEIKNNCEVFGYFATGLQPYDDSHAPISCPECCHEYHRIHNELLGLKNSKDLIDAFRSSELKNQLHEIIKEDPDVNSWRFFQMPKAGSDAEEYLHKLLDSAFFLKDDILKIGSTELLLAAVSVSHDRKRIIEGEKYSICREQVVIKSERDIAFERAVWDKKIQPISNRCYHDEFLFDSFPKVEKLSNEDIQHVHKMVVSFFSRSVDLPTNFSQIAPAPEDRRDSKEFIKAFDDLVLKKMRAGLSVLIKNEDGQRIDNKDAFFEFIQDLYDTATLPAFLTYIGIECGVEIQQSPAEKEKQSAPKRKKNQEDKSKCRKIAKATWEEHPTLMIKYMRKLPRILEIIGSKYSRNDNNKDTIHKWLAEVAPKALKEPKRPSKDEERKQHEICTKLGITP